MSFSREIYYGLQKIFQQNRLRNEALRHKKILRYRGYHADCISLGVGEPNFVTPEAGCRAAIKSIEDGITRYTSNSGLIELRRLISRYMETRYGLSYNPDNEIITTVGVSEGIDIAFMALLNPGDEVLLPEPCFVSYAPAVLLAGGVPSS